MDFKEMRAQLMDIVNALDEVLECEAGDDNEAKEAAIGKLVYKLLILKNVVGD